MKLLFRVIILYFLLTHQVVQSSLLRKVLKRIIRFLKGRHSQEYRDAATVNGTLWFFLPFDELLFLIFLIYWLGHFLRCLKTWVFHIFLNFKLNLFLIRYLICLQNNFQQLKFWALMIVLNLLDLVSIATHLFNFNFSFYVIFRDWCGYVENNSRKSPWRPICWQRTLGRATWRRMGCETTTGERKTYRIFRLGKKEKTYRFNRLGRREMKNFISKNCFFFFKCSTRRHFDSFCY